MPTRMANLSSGLLAAIALLSIVKLTDQLRFEAIQIPSLVQRGANFWLSCNYQLEPDDQLYSVKWYKNNEEFYRLLLSNQQQQQLPVSSNEQEQAANNNAAGRQQQYFSQNGVNVLVRLLNASLDSEGFYACEISTQNLSSIRYEREIRVYVLPHSRLSVIGFKNRYSMGDQLDLACATDYSRPRAALAWFINNQLIRGEQSHFTLELQNKSKLNEPTLFKQTLSLKFKLTAELMHSLTASAAAAAAAASTGEHSAGNRRNQGNQSLLAVGAGYHQVRPLKLQCKYKLTEVSDLTFNELLVHQKSSQANLRSPIASRRMMMTSITTDSVSVSRLPDQRLAQSKCPARRVQLQSGLFGRRPPLQDECRLGQLALQPDDPLMVEAEDSSDAAVELTESTLSEVPPPPPEDDSDTRRRRRRRRRQVIGGGEGLSVGDVISVNCSTISALLEDLAGPERGSAICSDLEARRRSLISGKYQHTDPLEPQAPNQRWTKPLNSNQGWTSRGQQQQQHQNLNGGKLVTTTTSQLMLTQRQLNDMLAPTDTAVNKPESTLFSGGAGGGNQLEAPPLLEWFINNQEVSPLGGQPTEGDSGPIDYVSYFANFDAKPLEQQLPLRLNLTKKHFMTPDSMLRLRCSSTQAQVLMADSVTLSIAPILTDSNQVGGQQVWQQKQQAPKQMHHRKLLKPSNLNSRQPLDSSLAAAAADNNNSGHQLKPQSSLTILLCILSLSSVLSYISL